MIYMPVNTYCMHNYRCLTVINVQPTCGLHDITYMYSSLMYCTVPPQYVHECIMIVMW